MLFELKKRDLADEEDRDSSSPVSLLFETS